MFNFAPQIIERQDLIMISQKYDVVVVGAGHAGSEAAHAAAGMGVSVLLITMNLQNIAQMSCNPAMGGVAKGQLLREIDALGGQSAMVTDLTAIQFRMLNRSKGPAMWSPRAQSDRMRFAEEWRLRLERNTGVDFFQDAVVDLMIASGRVTGVRTAMGVEIKARRVILTAGTFLNGLIHIGEKSFGGGRAGERASKGITERLVDLGFEAGRMKTGTPPRVDGRSLDYSRMEEQAGDEQAAKFSFSASTQALSRQRPCHITHTNSRVHEILREGFDRSPMFNGAIESIGPRYCPSIEDKIERFSTKDSHQIFVEPEGWETVEVYVNGFSTSLPDDIQIRALREVRGFEKAKIFRPGYAIEYDFFQPTQCKHSLETKLIDGLYFAGQINGTTGYEEAACQGLMAGINAARSLQGGEALVLRRDQAYIGVLIYDLVTRGTEEPYRMFTSRAEYRILLRQDNADERLTPIGRDLGLIDDERWEAFHVKQSKQKGLLELLANESVAPEDINPLLSKRNSKPAKQKVKLVNYLKRPEIGLRDLRPLKSLSSFIEANNLGSEELEAVEIEAKYAGYLEKERENAAKIASFDGLKLPPHLDYSALKSLSHEAREKLIKQKPLNLGEAKAISGISPADISVLLVYLGR